MKLLVWVASLDLRAPFGLTPATHQLCSALAREGVELLVAPYSGPAQATLDWQAVDNAAAVQSEVFLRARNVLRRVRPPQARDHSGETLADRAIRLTANRLVRPRWQRAFRRLVQQQPDIDALLILGVPPNHFRGLPAALRREFHLPTIFFDADLPISLPDQPGYASGVRIYQGADLAELDLVLSTSLGAIPAVEALGAQRVEPFFYAADPDIFHPIPGTVQDIDVFFYGQGEEYREASLRTLLVEPSRRMPGIRMAVRGRFGMEMGHVEDLPYASFAQLVHYVARAKINACVVRDPHATTSASSTCRLFELAAMGACIVSSRYDGIQEWFTPDQDLFVVQDADAAVRTYQMLLDHPERRQAAGDRARAAVLARHTYRHRARQLIGLVDGLKAAG